MLHRRRVRGDEPQRDELTGGWVPADLGDELTGGRSNYAQSAPGVRAGSTSIRALEYRVFCLLEDF